jgi:hypothetical protein
MLIENRPSLSSDQVEILGSSLRDVLTQLGEMKEIVRSNQSVVEGLLELQRAQLQAQVTPAPTPEPTSEPTPETGV